MNIKGLTLKPEHVNDSIIRDKRYFLGNKLSKKYLYMFANFSRDSKIKELFNEKEYLTDDVSLNVYIINTLYQIILESMNIKNKLNILENELKKLNKTDTKFNTINSSKESLLMRLENYQN
jgi:hypothetical protein